MLSDNLMYVVLIALVGMAALAANYVITTREAQNKFRSERLKWLKQQSEHTLNALSILKEVGCRSDIVEKLNQHAMSLIEEISALAPDSELMTEIARNKESTDRVKRRQGGLESDRAVRRAQIYLNFAEKLLIEMGRKGRLTPQLAKAYQQELYWLNVSMVTEAHVNQAQRLLASGEKHGALAHYKHAKAILVRATISQQQKQVLLNQLQSEIDKLQPKRDYGAGALADSIDNYLNQ
ncbi:DNA topoisomerase I [Marinobacterium sp. D7]|uniref:DNA topoisomerase I n=1 Tax=Marinobacterium ramblicola TaxID=2849041 RepID=UPI001C2D4D56|nr:DNA topoisomerase I [Marinobacterium ramblicola]MBV1786517.1 DNA topoisomerase I [Marinobacterium ramblicola]